MAKTLKEIISKSLEDRKKAHKKKKQVGHYTSPSVDVPDMELEPLHERAEKFAEEKKKEEAKKVKKAKPKEDNTIDTSPRKKKKKKKKDSMSDYLSSDLDVPFD